MIEKIYTKDLILRKAKESDLNKIYEKENGVYEDRGLCIARKYQAKGYGKQVVEAFMKLIFEELNGNKFIYSCFSTNENSRKVCLHFGFKYLETKNIVRDYDNAEFVSDYYYMNREMYEEYMKK